MELLFGLWFRISEYVAKIIRFTSWIVTQRKSRSHIFVSISRDNGDGLLGNCEYTLNGVVPNARYWSYAIYGNDNYYLQDPNNLKSDPTYEDLFAQVTNGYEIIRNIGETYEIKIGNNLVNQDGTLSHFGNDFNLILRIYGPDLQYYDDPSSIPVAKILKESCK